MLNSVIISSNCYMNQYLRPDFLFYFILFYFIFWFTVFLGKILDTEEEIKMKIKDTKNKNKIHKTPETV